MRLRVAFLAFFVGFCAFPAKATHFRGAIITWKPHPTVKGTVIFSFKIAWRKTSVQCTDANIAAQTPIGSGSWTCYSGCSGTIGSTQFVCTAYSISENWAQGENTFTSKFTGNGPFVIRFASCCWISNLVAGSDGRWSVPVTVDLNVRSDTGKINSSPISATAPIIRLQQYCDYSIPVHTDDPDGDVVKCRWAQNVAGGVEECGGVCGSLSGATLSARPCVIHYKATVLGWHAVSLMIEDFATASSRTPLSKVPLQFLIKVDAKAAGAKCGGTLTYTNDTMSDNQCVALKSNGAFKTRIGVVETSAARLKEVLIVASVGTSKSNIQGVYPKRYVDVTWTPTQAQKGSHVFCFSALDTLGVALKQRCITILAGADPPEIVPGSQRPVNETTQLYQKKFAIAFTQEVTRPASSRYIRIYETNAATINALPRASSRQVAAVNTLSASAVLIKNTSLTFYLPWSIRLAPNVIHYITIDNGAVVGLGASCAGDGIPFGGIRDRTMWSFPTVNTSSDPCEGNGGRGSCQKVCETLNSAYGSYRCRCSIGEILAPNKHTCYRPDRPIDCSGNCSGHGICLGNGLCDCDKGWFGSSCSDPTCYRMARCSGHGDCVAPEVCSCHVGWTGPACSVDLCSIHRTCSSCTSTLGCGWCDSDRRCMAGSGNGPDSAVGRLDCRTWLYYGCMVAVDASTPACTKASCSDQISSRDCNERCIDSHTPRLSGRGSLSYCDRLQKACRNYATCFSYQSAGANDCPTWNEAKCPLGVPPSSSPVPDDAPTKGPGDSGSAGSGGSGKHARPFNSLRCDGPVKVDVRGFQARGQAVVEAVIRIIQESRVFTHDNGMMLRMAWVESEYGNARGTFCTLTNEIETRAGIWQTDVSWLANVSQNSEMNRKFDSIRKTFDIDMRSVTINDLHLPLVSALVARAKLFSVQPVIPPESDIQGQAHFWFKHYRNEKAYSWEIFKDTLKYQPKALSKSDKGCVRGLRDPNQNCKCLCERGYQGEKCDEPDCGCNPSPCSNHGMCVASPGGGKSFCRCRGRWQGSCCNSLPPSPVFGDPHLQTLDGLKYDYFGIGVFWGCISRQNDFGYQLAFFKYKKTSLLGAVVLKVGSEVVSVVSIGNNTGNARQALIRINGSSHALPVGNQMELANGDVTLSANRGRNAQVLVSYLFQYRNGISVNVEAIYSSPVGRQYLDLGLGASVVLEGKTTGLCGVMDDNTGNDLASPDGVLRSANSFGDAWKVSSVFHSQAGSAWSWNASNFRPSDVAGKEYTDAQFVPQYHLSGYSSFVISNAQRVCRSQGLTGGLLNDCVLDVVVTGDTSFADQNAFMIGNCPNDCSNHGYCVNNTCVCFGFWSGDDCSEGGRGNCPNNSYCSDGFCECNFGFVFHEGQCIEATCTAVGNCTSPSQGRCKAIDECLCRPGYSLPDCSQRVVCPLGSPCSSGRGVCSEGGKCACLPNWSGPGCSVSTCESFQNCSGNGICNSGGLCDCNVGWEGGSCSFPTCYNVNNCSGNGKCIGTDKCQCDAGFAFPACDEPIQCPAMQNCSGNGICLSSSSCLCYEGYTGPSCADSLCPSDCSNQGKCVGAHLCSCLDGWTGQDCSDPSCENLDFCSGNGDCIDYDLCECSRNWTGFACDVPRCLSELNVDRNSSVQCSGRGVCVGPGRCSCDPGYYGDLCEIQVRGNCSANGMCTCSSGWTGSLCDDWTCDDFSNCSNHGVCNGPNVCTCRNGYVGYDCSTPVCHDNCSSHGTCISPNECICDVGYTGQYCSTPICATNCSGHGQCNRPEECACEFGYTDDVCSTPLCFMNCTDHGQCLDPDVCQCNSGYAGQFCGTPLCVANCSGHGLCSRPGECVCDPGYTDSICSTPMCFMNCSGHGHCSRPDECVCDLGYSDPICSTPLCFKNCSGHGQCMSPDECNCDAGYTGLFCSTPICVSNCSGHGLCSRPNECVCDPEYTDSICSTPICFMNCSGHGHCSRPDECVCDLGYSDPICSTPLCFRNCFGHGKCMRPAECNCDAGYSGLFCSTPICVSNCSGHGLCSRPNECVCDSGYSDQVCSTPLCFGNCSNHGSCLAPEICGCDAGYTGQFCSNPVCSKKCFGNGLCTGPDDCQCDDGYSEQFCSTPICHMNCSSHGFCFRPDECACYAGYTGRFCSTPLCFANCSGRGACFGPDQCVCHEGYTGSFCDTPVCVDDCSGHGNCIDPNDCLCYAGYGGKFCADPMCFDNCSGNGNCTKPYTCVCHKDYTGETCSSPICPNECNGHGSCLEPGRCICYQGYTGLSCSEPVCDSNCNDNGNCTSPNACDCYEGFTGDLCSESLCFGNCSGHGQCMGENRCTCDNGYEGIFCEGFKGGDSSSVLPLWAIILILVGGVILIVIALVVAVVRAKKKKTKAYQMKFDDMPVVLPPRGAGDLKIEATQSGFQVCNPIFDDAGEIAETGEM